MKGYLSFILAFASIFLILSFIAINLESTNINMARTLAVERSYQIQLNLKEAMIGSAKAGALDGYQQYAMGRSDDACTLFCKERGVCLLPKTPPCNKFKCKSFCFKESDAEDAAEEGAATRMAEVQDRFDQDDISISIWCDRYGSLDERSLSRRISQDGSAKPCHGCYPAGSLCSDVFDADVIPDSATGSYYLGSLGFSPTESGGSFGSSVYLIPGEISSVSTIPESYIIEYDMLDSMGVTG